MFSPFTSGDQGMQIRRLPSFIIRLAMASSVFIESGLEVYNVAAPSERLGKIITSLNTNALEVPSSDGNNEMSLSSR